SSRTRPRCLHLLSGAATMGRGVVEQCSHRCCPTLTAPTQCRVGELPHYGAAGRAATSRLGIDLGEEIVRKGNHDLCHAVSIPSSTTGWGGARDWGKKPTDPSRSPLVRSSENSLET